MHLHLHLHLYLYPQQQWRQWQEWQEWQLGQLAGRNRNSSAEVPAPLATRHDTTRPCLGPVVLFRAEWWGGQVAKWPSKAILRIVIVIVIIIVIITAGFVTCPKINKAALLASSRAARRSLLATRYSYSLPAMSALVAFQPSPAKLSTQQHHQHHQHHQPNQRPPVSQSQALPPPSPALTGPPPVPPKDSKRRNPAQAYSVSAAIAASAAAAAGAAVPAASPVGFGGGVRPRLLLGAAARVADPAPYRHPQVERERDSRESRGGISSTSLRVPSVQPQAQGVSNQLW